MKIQALGHVVLKVRNLDRALQFYQGVLGLRLAARAAIRDVPMAFLAIDRNHHDLALMEVGEQAPAAPEKSTGLAHFALKIGDNLEALRSAREYLQSMNIPIDRTVEHRVSQSHYVRDPDGHVVELYVDADPSIWHHDPASVAHSEPLDL
ncbi:MAG TPA: VOC family protein [Burkholderiales bacterium]|nr:VOC family protein [Burkholderiales bacterium]